MNSAKKYQDELRDGQSLLQEVKGLHACLDAAPHFCFSDVGRKNLCKRFRLTDDQLTAVLLAYGAMLPTPQLEDGLIC
ncbi:hypothetical protein [Hymenobacter crusticola]|uniref:Uncharacterized protein n=1 Tax=Hymenobacter crusticola TaxID=1770526 RepID=A0A243W559_9BACT|nr:hypothetical protein [Hymenobacter crusticola]OUJ68044.1 hypothetical protein BXP70_28140 [Hymenobacter crusticola]